MIFKTSTPKKQSFVPLPRSSTPNKFYSLVKNNVNDNNKNQTRVPNEKCCQHYQTPMIKLDLLLYRPKSEYYYHGQNIQQIWDI